MVDMPYCIGNLSDDILLLTYHRVVSSYRRFSVYWHNLLFRHTRSFSFIYFRIGTRSISVRHNTNFLMYSSYTDQDAVIPLWDHTIQTSTKLNIFTLHILREYTCFQHIRLLINTQTHSRNPFDKASFKKEVKTNAGEELPLLRWDTIIVQLCGYT